MRARFEFEESWPIAGTPEELGAMLVDLEHYPAWWPQVLAVAKVGPDDARVLCRSVLPYTLDLGLHAVSRTPPTLEVALSGDLDGWVRWHLHPTAAGSTRLTWEQTAEVGGPLAAAARVAGPLLRWNHARMMAGCRAGLTEAFSRARPTEGC
ncbi:SRPBCC family protein [Nocardioides insulae]|uniref:SRPBCC family protein n=1 Tax=Nocardioides insulae TaxID=394734 RepID=UPI000409CACF|nr:SRPBCC family protein [Nocardioides insulae]